MLRHLRHSIAISIAVALFTVIGIVTIMVNRAYQVTKTSTVSSAYEPQSKQPKSDGPNGDPTPWPTTDLSFMTPVPTYTPLPPGATPDKGPLDSPPDYRPQPGDPFNVGVIGDRPPGPAIDIANNSATLIVSGTTTQVYPARWSTTDGKRPANPHASDSPYSIYAPVEISVDSYLKGAPQGSKLYLEAFGGTVGQDSVQWASDDLYTFQAGDHVIVFLAQSSLRSSLMYEGSPVWRVIEHYTISNGVAANHYDSRPLDDLLRAIKTNP